MVPSESVPEPFNTIELTGRVMDLFPPALATGATLAAGFTVTVASSEPTAPWLSVTVNLNTYVPATKPEAVRLAVVALVNAAAHPDALDQQTTPMCRPVPVP